MGICVCTCSERDPAYFLDMRFLIVSFTDLTFFPREIRDVVGDFTASLYRASCSLCQGERKRERLSTPKTSWSTQLDYKHYSCIWELKSRGSERKSTCVLTLGSVMLTTWRERLDRSNPPKLHVLCRKKRHNYCEFTRKWIYYRQSFKPIHKESQWFMLLFIMETTHFKMTSCQKKEFMVWTDFLFK